jgi:TIR domain-containing protein
MSQLDLWGWSSSLSISSSATRAAMKSGRHGRPGVWSSRIPRRAAGVGFRCGNRTVDMEEAIQQAKRLTAIALEAYIRSKSARQEWTAYMERNASLVIPVQIEDTITPSMLRTLQRINLVGLEEQEAEKKLLGKIADLAGAPRYQRRDRQNGRESASPEFRSGSRCPALPSLPARAAALQSAQIIRSYAPQPASTNVPGAVPNGG